jgi:hypothetical protein
MNKWRLLAVCGLEERDGLGHEIKIVAARFDSVIKRGIAFDLTCCDASEVRQFLATACISKSGSSQLMVCLS